MAILGECDDLIRPLLDARADVNAIVSVKKDGYAAVPPLLQQSHAFLDR